MHVDGFRFDLATHARARRARASSTAHAPIFQIISQDPVLSRVKLIAEPWDVRPRRLPGRATSRRRSREWNGKYRDAIRRYWKGDENLASRDRLPADRARPTCTRASGASRRPASTSSPRTTASRCTTSSPTAASTTRPTASTTRTAPTTTSRGTTASRARPTTRRSSRCASGRSGTCWRRCSCRRACRCCWPATRWAAPSAATTTPTARTTSSPGSTGTLDDGARRCSSSRGA